MDAGRRFLVGALLFGTAALVHALVTWPLRETIAIFIGGAAIAFIAEAVGVRLGLLRHHTHPRIAGVPVAVVLAWPATAYGFYRGAALVVSPGLPAALLAAVTATLYDVGTDHIGVERGLWDYPPSAIPGPSLRGVPWWNFAAWFCLVLCTAMLPVVAGSG